MIFHPGAISEEIAKMGVIPLAIILGIVIGLGISPWVLV